MVDGPHGKNRLKQWIAEGKFVPAIWAELASPITAEAAVYAGWPAVIIDNEHGPANLEQAVHILRAVEAAGGEAVLRAPEMDPTYLKLALDRGFRSIMAPMINDAAAAQAFAAACRYPPLGKRGYAAPITRSSRYGADAGYAHSAHEELFLMAQIETPEAIANAAAIAAVDGIDMLFVGPNDLAAIMGHLERMDAPEVVQALDSLEAAARAAGAPLGSVLRPGCDVKALRERGYQLIGSASDIGLFVEGARRDAAAHRAVLGFEG